MVNRHRGEIEARLNGTSYRLCLTLGALAELESAFGDADMLALASRFETGRISARDAIRIVGAGLRGGGNDIADTAVGHMQADGGAAGFVAIVAALLNATFGGPAEPGNGGRAASADASAKEAAAGERGPAPFPGTRR